MLKGALALLFLSASVARADVIIGVAGPLTGQYQSFGLAMVNGVKAAVDRINSDGGINGEQAVIVTADDQCDTLQAREAANKLLAAQVDMVVGHFCSNASVEAAKIYDNAGVTMIAPAAILPRLTESRLSNVIRVATRSDAQGAFAAKRILVKRPSARLLLVNDGSAEMSAITTSFVAAYVKDPSLTATIIPDQKDFTDLVTKAKSADIDTVFIATSASDAGRFTAQAAKSGLDLKRYGPDTLLNDAFWAMSASAGENTLVSFPLDPEVSIEAKVLGRDLKALGQATDGPFWPSYAGVQLFSAAAQSQGAHSRSKIASYLKSNAEFQTILGPFTFDSKGDARELRFNWHSWNNGVYQTIATETP